MTEQATSSPALSSGSAALLTFLIADVRGYTRFTTEHGDEAAARLADRFASFCEEVVGRHDGQVIELRGDEALSVFSSARQALHAAVALQQACREATTADPSLPLTVGMGLDAGEPIPLRGGYRGGALNLAARLCSIAGAGEILASQGVIHLARKTEGLVFVDRGEVALKGLAAPVRVLQIGQEGELPDELPPLQPVLVTHPTNLPDEPTPFIGREGEIAAITGLLRDPPIRLVTLTGPGGTGKTRLALQVGMTLLYDFPDGVFVCDLSSVPDPSLLPSIMAGVLGIKEEGSKALIETVIERLQESHLLLVLDNFEHLLDASSVVARLLDACRELHILVTSRIPLHLSREQEYPVPPLSVPDLHHLPALPLLLDYESIALFVGRASAVRPGFTLTEENAPAVVAICSRLDGLPLALELAATRIKLFPPQALLQRLDSRLKLLTGGAKDKPTRQQTLRGAIDWSYSLLTEEEQVLVARLSVFAGGWSFEAAEAVCDPEGDLDLLDGMSSLVDKSLIRQEGETEPRFSMLETIREYAAEKLMERGEEDQTRAAHAEHFVSIAVEAAKYLMGPDQVSWLDRLEREHDNFRLALRWAIDRGDAELGMRLAVGLDRFWYWRGHSSESRALRESLLALPTGANLLGLRAHILEGMSFIALRQGDYAAARAYVDEALPIVRQADDPKLLVMTLGDLGFVARVQGDYTTARAALEEGLTIARRLGDAFDIARSLHLLGLLALEADGDLDAAWTLNEQSLVLLRRVGHHRMSAVVAGNMGRIARARGDFSTARVLLLESVRAFRDIGDLGIIPMMLYTLAAVDTDEGHLERAVRLQAAAIEMEQTLDARVWPENQRERDSWLGLARSELGEESFARAWTEGKAMSVEQAISYALEEIT